MRLGAFHDQVLSWAERPCTLTVTVSATGSTVRVAGILRSYFSESSLSGWALIPPQQHGGFASLRLTELHFDRCEDRRVIAGERGNRLRYVSDNAVFELERDDAHLTAPPRVPTAKAAAPRYHYVGGRRKTAPERWMLS